MLRSNQEEARDCLQEAIANLPSDADARSEFFLRWRARTAAALEVLFHDNPELAGRFKQIEFSPRRLTKDDARDSQLRLDAYLAGCAGAKTLLEELLRKISEPPPAKAESKKSETAPHDKSQSVATDASDDSSSDQLKSEPAVPIKGGTMETNQTCVPVRSSLSRVLGAWDRGDAETAAVISAQLLAELTLLSRQDRFKAAFQSVVTKAFPPQAAQAMDLLTASAPLCVWSVVAAINEVMKA